MVMRAKLLFVLFKATGFIQLICFYCGAVLSLRAEYLRHTYHLTVWRASFLSQMYHISSFPGDKFIDPIISLTPKHLAFLMHGFMIVMHKQCKNIAV